MERTHSVNFTEESMVYGLWSMVLSMVNFYGLRQNKGVLLNTFVKKTTVIRFLSVHSIYLSFLAFRIDVECCIYRLWCFSNISNNSPLFCLSTG